MLQAKYGQFGPPVCRFDNTLLVPDFIRLQMKVDKFQNPAICLKVIFFLDGKQQKPDSDTVYYLELIPLLAFIILSEFFPLNSNADLSKAVLQVMEEKGILLSKLAVSGLAAITSGHGNRSHLGNKR